MDFSAAGEKSSDLKLSGIIDTVAYDWLASELNIDVESNLSNKSPGDEMADCFFFFSNQIRFVILFGFS